MPVRGIRGATTASENTAEAINEATEDLLRQLTALNDLDPNEIACVYFTSTSDLDAEFPAHAARRLGWTQVALLCGPEINVGSHNPRAIPKCIRVLILYNTPRPQTSMRFAYLRGAEAIRVDLEASRS